jgi:hypothetical protein
MFAYIKIIHPGGELLLKYVCVREMSGPGYYVASDALAELRNLLSRFNNVLFKCGDKFFIPHLTLKPYVHKVQSRNSFSYYLSQFGGVQIIELGLFSSKTTLELQLISKGSSYLHVHLSS